MSVDTEQIKVEIRKLSRADKIEIYRWIDEEVASDLLSMMEKDCYAYQGPLGQVVHNGLYFYACRDGFLIGTYNTFEEAMASLELKERPEPPESK
jgi:hypothetical protein